MSTSSFKNFPQLRNTPYLRLIHTLIFLPGFVAVLILRGDQPERFGISIEYLLFATTGAIAAGLFAVAATDRFPSRKQKKDTATVPTKESEKKKKKKRRSLGEDQQSSDQLHVTESGSPKLDARQLELQRRYSGDGINSTGVWSSGVVMELLSIVPFLISVPLLFSELLQSAEFTSLELLGAFVPALSILPYVVYELAGYSVVSRLVPTSVSLLSVLMILGGSIAITLMNRRGVTEAEFAVGIALALWLVGLAMFCLLRIRQLFETPRT